MLSLYRTHSLIRRMIFSFKILHQKELKEYCLLFIKLILRKKEILALLKARRTFNRFLVSSSNILMKNKRILTLLLTISLIQ